MSDKMFDDIVSQINPKQEVVNRLIEKIEDPGKKTMPRAINKFIAVACTVLIMIGFMAIVGFDNIAAAVKSVIYYLPGFNVEESDNTPSKGFPAL
jgi:predicted PurR-regulated permease PerM